MPNIESVICCQSYSRDEGGFLSLSGIFHGAKIPSVPLSIRFALIVFISGLVTKLPHILHIEFYGPDGMRIDGEHRVSVTIDPPSTQFFELTINVNQFPLTSFGAYRVELRFDDDLDVSHVGRFEMSQGARLPPSMASRVPH